MGYTQTPGFTKEMGAGITKVINQLQSTDPKKDITSGETTGTSAKTQGDNTTVRRNLNFKKVEVDKGGTESVVDQNTGKEIITNATQRAANKAASNNNLRGEITGNVVFDKTSGSYSAAPYKGKKLMDDAGGHYGYKSHQGEVTKFTGMSIRDKNIAKKNYEKNQNMYNAKANQAVTRFNSMSKTHRDSQ
ncbi:hypothetical protein N8035_02400 [Algibacter sp.]|nr:hypothetical protein [Algibacter sp.]